MFDDYSLFGSCAVINLTEKRLLLWRCGFQTASML